MPSAKYRIRVSNNGTIPSQNLRLVVSFSGPNLVVKNNDIGVLKPGEYKIVEDYAYGLVNDAYYNVKAELFNMDTYASTGVVTTTQVYVPKYFQKHASITKIEIHRDWEGFPTGAMVYVKNDGNQSASFWVGASIRDSRWYVIDLLPQQTYYMPPGSLVSFWFYFGNYKETIKTYVKPVYFVTAIWEGYDGKNMVPPRYDYKEVQIL